MEFFIQYVNDFRKIVGIESYAPTDNVSELTARTNDEGWATVFVEWLKVSKLQARDALFIFSVGGGNLEKNISPNLVEALPLTINPNGRSLRLLLAEDNLVNQKLAVTQLRRLGHSVAVASNGRETLQALLREPFDAVFLDCQIRK